MRINIGQHKSEDEEEPCPPSQWSSLSQPPSPDYSTSSSEDEDDDGNVAGQQPQPSQWTLPPKPRRRLVHNFIGAPSRKSIEAVHITPASTPLSILLLFFTEIVTLLVVETNRYYHQFLDNFEDRTSPPTWGDRSKNVFVFGSDITSRSF